jgi:hypothetical protein
VLYSEVMSTTHTSHEDKYAERIAKLLAKAESTTPEEAELLVAKAQELMTTYAISQAMIDAKGGVERDEIVEVKIRFEGTYRLAQFDIARTLAVANNCRVLQSTGGGGGGRRSYYRYQTPHKTIYVIGFKSDVDRVELLNASLQIQCARALGTWWKNDVDEYNKSWWTSHQKSIERREFIFGFSNGLANKLFHANEAARAADAAERAAAENITETEASDSVALVLRSREDRVSDWMDETYGKLGKGRGGAYSSGSHSSRSAGNAAGRSASTGTGHLRSQGALSR